MKSVLVVCHGNVCRSPAAEKILRKMYPDLSVVSAGLRCTPGKIISRKMRTVLEVGGYDSDGRSKIITDEMIAVADVVLYMDDSNALKLLSMIGHEGMQKCKRISDLLGIKSIKDPNFSPIDRHYAVVGQLERAFATEKFKEWIA